MNSQSFKRGILFSAVFVSAVWLSAQRNSIGNLVDESFVQKVKFWNTSPPPPKKEENSKISKATTSQTIQIFEENVEDLTGPGGIGQNLALWLKADNGVSVNENNLVISWESTLGAPLTLVHNLSAPYLPYNDNTTYSNTLNFNPTISFDGTNRYLYNNTDSYLNPDDADGAVHYIVVASGRDRSTAARCLFAIKGDDDGFFYSGDGVNTAFPSIGNRFRGTAAHIPNTADFGIYSSILPKPEMGNQRGYYNGFQKIYEGPIYPVGGTYYSLPDMGAYVGADGTTLNNFKGEIAEVILLHTTDGGDIEESDLEKIHSYLAIKYGISLTETHDYFDSDGQVIWSRTANEGYNQNIVGIGKDENSGLNQKQSKSSNPNQKLIIGAGSTLSNLNSTNTNLVDNQEFLLVGDNGGVQNLKEVFLKSDAPGGKINFKFEAVWKVQATDNIGEVTIAWPKGISNLHLIKSSDSTLDFSDEFLPMTNEINVNGTLYNAVTTTFQNGEFFSFAGFMHAPGGIIPELWNRADDVNIFNASNDPVNDNDKVAQWNDFYGKGYNFTQTNNTYRPVYSNTTLLNFNPTITFNNSQHLAFTPVEDIIHRADGTMYAAGFMNNLRGCGIFGFDNSMDYPGIHTSTNGLYNMLFYSSGSVYTNLTPNSFEASYPFVTGANWVNGMGQDPNHASSYVSLNGTTTFNNGNQMRNVNISSVRNVRVGSDSNWGYMDGQLNELIIYENPLTPSEMNKVDSYLAIKYGITLDKEVNYTTSLDAIVWNSSQNYDYYNNVFGIGKDEISDLNQKQSKSSNPNQKLVIGAGSTLFNTNKENPNIIQDGQFLVVGDNGEKQSLSELFSNPAAPGGEVNYRFAAVWKVQNTNGVGTVSVAWPKSIENLHLVRSTDEVFDNSDEFIFMENEVNINGVDYVYATINFNNGDYFTLAGYAHAPAGVFNGLAYWYRADKQVEHTGEGTDITGWRDYFSGTLSSQLGDSPLPKYAEGTANYFNFNPGINFTANTQKIGNISVQTLTSLDFDIFTLTKEGMSGTRFFNIGRNNTVFGADNWDSPGFYANGSIATRNSTGGGLVIANPGNINFSTTVPSIMYHKFTDTSMRKGLNGAAEGAARTYTARGEMTGGHIFGANRYDLTGGDDLGFLGHIGETIIYGDGSLDEEERRRVDSYLAIKYGLTLSRVQELHYLGSTASSNSIIWNGSLNTDYNNNIFGIARSEISGFDQKVSRSVNSGTILTISTTNDFVSSNIAPGRAKLASDESYLLIGDNNNTSALVSPAPEIGECGEVIEEEGFKLIPRKWMVQRTATVGTVYLEVDMASYMTEINSGYTLLIADDEDFTQNVAMIPGVANGNKVVFSYNFDAGNPIRYFTFGGTYEAAPCEQCKGGSFVLRTGYEWNQNTSAWENQITNQKVNVLLGTDAEGTSLYASLYADYTEEPSVEYIPNRYPQRYSGKWTISRRYDNTNAKAKHRVVLSKAMKASFQISNINTFQNNKNNFEVIGYCNGSEVMPKITYAYNTAYHTFEIEGNKVIGTMSWRGFVPNVSTANVRFDRPVEEIVIICSVERVNNTKTLRSVLYGDMTLECAEVVEPTPDNVYVSHSFTQNELATCGGETTMRIKVTNNNVCDDKTIDLHQVLPAGLEYVPDSFNGTELPSGSLDNASVSYSGGNFNLTNLSLPYGEHYFYIDVTNPSGVEGTYPTQFTFEVTNGLDPNFTYESPEVDLTYYDAGPQPLNPELSLSIKEVEDGSISCGTNGGQITYRLKIDNTNSDPITEAEILQTFDYDQTIVSYNLVSGEDEDGVITGELPVDGDGNLIDPIGGTLFNLTNATIPVGVSYIDIVVDLGNSYDIEEVNNLGLSASFLVGFGSGDCAESGESISNEVILMKCTDVCTKPGYFDQPADGYTQVGITTLNKSENWPESIPNGWLALESNTKGLVITRVNHESAITEPVEGMLIYDKSVNCVKLYNGTSWKCIQKSCNE